MKALVFGFSVTGDTPGYVEFWQKTHAGSHMNLDLQKIAIGGIQPGMGRYLVATMLDKYKPDLAIFELATPVYRLRPPSNWILRDHRETVNFIIRLCAEKKIKCGFLDLPQEGVDPTNDWMSDIHGDLLKRCGVPWISVDLTPDTLRDNVHPNDTGRTIYADALERLVRKMKRARTAKYKLAHTDTFYDSLHIDEMEHKGGIIADFERNGFETTVLQLGARETATLRLPQPLKVVGVLIGMGPRTGYMDVRIHNEGEIISCFDQFCYYQRMGGRLISPKVTDEITIVQGQVIPERELNKGTKSFEPRIGTISHIFYDAEWGAPLGAERRLKKS